MYCASVCNLKWLFALYTKKTHSLKVSRCCMWCFHWPYRLAGRMMEDKVDHAFAHIFWVIAILRFGVALQHCQQAAGNFSSKAWSSPVNAMWCYSSWTRIGPVENLQCYSIALSHFSADVYFPASAISIFCSIQKKKNIYISKFIILTRKKCPRPVPLTASEK